MGNQSAANFLNLTSDRQAMRELQPVNKNTIHVGQSNFNVPCQSASPMLDLYI